VAQADVPELPEVETVRRGLARHAVGRRVESVEVGRERAVRRTSREAVISGLTGATLTAARRRGKYLIVDLDTGWALMVHLRMSGQLLLSAHDVPRPAHTHVVMDIGEGPNGVREEIRFVDPRTFGEVVVFDPDETERDLPELARLGIDPIVDDFTPEAFRRAIAGRRRRLKALLLDQHVVAGIGNIYADEILHRAGLHPDRLASQVSARQIARLHLAITEVLGEAIAAGGSSLRDAQYVDLSGSAGRFQLEHRVYGRTGQMCLTCGRSPIVRRSDQGRGTHLCPTCQRRPRSSAPAGIRDRGRVDLTR
jgi:formamidopyrimidine-DNA glycosylase